MRQPQKSNRARGRGGRKGGGGGGGGGNNLNRVYESAGPEGKVRGTPQQIVEKYLSLARDAQTSGDRVTAENFLQHAEHYQRIVLQSLGVQEERRDAAMSEQDDDDDDDYGHAAPASQPPQRSGEGRPHGGGEGRQHGGGEHRQHGGGEGRHPGGGEHRTQGAGHPHGNGRDHAQSVPPAAPEPMSVSPLTTIDLSEDGAPDLLVTTETPVSAQPVQPRRPRRPRTRRPVEGEGPQPAVETAEPVGNGDAD